MASSGNSRRACRARAGSESRASRPGFTLGPRAPCRHDAQRHPALRALNRRRGSGKPPSASQFTNPPQAPRSRAAEPPHTLRGSHGDDAARRQRQRGLDSPFPFTPPQATSTALPPGPPRLRPGCAACAWPPTASPDRSSWHRPVRSIRGLRFRVRRGCPPPRPAASRSRCPALWTAPPA